MLGLGVAGALLFGGRKKDEQISKTVNEAIMEITQEYITTVTNNSTSQVDMKQIIEASNSKFTCTGDFNVNQTVTGKFKEISEFTPQNEMDLKKAIQNGLDNKVNEKLSKDSGPLTMFAKPTKQSSVLENKMKTIINDKVRAENIQNIIKTKNITNRVNLEGAEVYAVNCNLDQKTYVEMISIEIVAPITKMMADTKYLQELSSEKKLVMWNGMSLTQGIVLIVSCVAMVMCMMIALMMMRESKG